MRSVPLLVVLLLAACGGDDDGGGAGDPDAAADTADASPDDPDAAAAVLFPGPCRLDIDNGADGAVDSRSHYAYDDAGHTILDETLLPADDTVVNRRTYEFNAEGQLIAGTFDSDLSTEVLDSRDTYTYDEDGNQILGESKHLDGDTVDSRTARTFDTMNRVTRIEMDYDTSVDGLDRVITYDYMSDRYLQENDDGDNASVDSRYTYIHGDDDLIDREEYDLGANDSIDKVYEHTYDGQGRETHYYEDGDNDGTFEYEDIYAYDSFGVATWEWDSDGDGEIDGHQIYTYDDAGNLLLRESDEGLDDDIDWRATYFYDCD